MPGTAFAGLVGSSSQAMHDDAMTMLCLASMLCVIRSENPPLRISCHGMIGVWSRGAACMLVMKRAAPLEASHWS